MFEIFDEIGITLSEIIGAALVLAGFSGAMVLFSKYGYYFVQMLAG